MAFFERDTTLERMMMDGDLDAAVSERSFSHPAISQHLLGTYRLALVWPTAWSRRRRAITPTVSSAVNWLIDRPFITYESGQMVRLRSIEYLTRMFDGMPPQNLDHGIRQHQRHAADPGRPGLWHRAGMVRRRNGGRAYRRSCWATWSR